jgi:hypothetical protein
MALVSPKKVIIDTDPGIGKQTPCYSQTLSLSLSLSLSRGMSLVDSNWCGEQAEFWDANVQMGYHHRADDAIAILFAFQSPELDVIGLTTTYGNVKTTMATNNALHLVGTSSSLSLSLFLLSNLSCLCNSSYVFTLGVWISGLLASLCVAPFQFVLFLQFQLCICT